MLSDRYRVHPVRVGLILSAVLAALGIAAIAVLQYVWSGIMSILRYVFVALLLATPAVSQERITLTTPIVQPSITDYQVRSITFDMGADPDRSNTIDDRVTIVLIPNVPDREPFTHQYEGATAATINRQINRANLSTISLERRIMERLDADNVLDGTVTGTPQ
jgi:hypothetical protein